MATYSGSARDIIADEVGKASQYKTEEIVFYDWFDTAEEEGDRF